ncbi:MAG: hypothetical protein JXJ20_09800 [Anaerolineae bacterium]|nr:hypothetical protein [Anaerolineae bacterium]
MQRGRLMMVLGLFLALDVCLMSGIVLFVLASNNDDNTADNTTVEQADSFEPITVGVLLTGSLDDYGWQSLGGGAVGYAETDIADYRVLIYANLNPAGDSGYLLENETGDLVERGARYIFIAPDFAAADKARVVEHFPGVVFITNVYTRRDVERLLPGLAGVEADAGWMAPNLGVGAASAPGTASGPDTTEQVPASRKALGILLISLVIVLGTAGAAVWMNWNARPARSKPKRKRRRSADRAGINERELAIERRFRERKTDFAAQGEPLPLVHELSTYVQDDEWFDESFSIETPDGAYLGECGIGIARWAKGGEPGKTGGLEVWLFDKHDIDTDSRFLVTSRFLEDERAWRRLTAEGRTVEAKPDALMVLETKTLRLQVRVLGAEHGYDPDWHAYNYMDYIVVELAAWQKDGAGK